LVGAKDQIPNTLFTLLAGVEIRTALAFFFMSSGLQQPMPDAAAPADAENIPKGVVDLSARRNRTPVVPVLLYIEIHDSAEDSTVYTVPLNIVPELVIKVLLAQPNNYEICIDDDGWSPLVETLQDAKNEDDGDDENDEDALTDACDEFFDGLQPNRDEARLLNNGVAVEFVVKRFCC
jgi:hypothetical protein